MRALVQLWRWVWPTRWADMSLCRPDPRHVCAEAVAAIRSHRLVWSPIFQGWICHDLPVRRMSDRARFFAFKERWESGHVDHSGEPYVLEFCPYCYGELPLPIPERQADGSP